MKALQDYIEEYKQSAVKFGEASAENNHRLVNKCHDRIIKALLEIRKFGTQGDIALLSLTADTNESIKCWSATHSLKYNEEKAKMVLQELAENKSSASFDAKIVLSEWQKGTLELP